jgi:hypothetical protein
MFCRFCGATLAADSIFCHSCGKSLSEQPRAPKTDAAEIKASMNEGLGLLKATLMVVACFIIFVLVGFGFLANLGLVGVDAAPESSKSIGQTLFCFTLAVVFGAGTVFFAKQWFIAITSSDTDGKHDIRSFLKAMYRQWGLATASFVPIVAIYHFAAMAFGVKTPLSQILATAGFLMTLSLGCGGFAYWLISGFFSNVLGISGKVPQVFGVAAVIATVAGLLYEFRAPSLLLGPQTPWINPAVLIFAGFGLSIVFGVYFWLIWKPISTWLKS